MKVVGILGAGQLAQMLSIAADKLKMRTVALAKHADDCAHFVTDIILADEQHPKAWEKFAKQADVITLETENIDLELAGFMAQRKPLMPNADALAIAQDRGNEKQTAQKLGIATAPFYLVDSKEDLQNAVAKIGLPGILKTRRFGYDGKGQYVLHTTEDIDIAWQALHDQPLILEGFVNFSCEVSLIGARSTQGETAFYPLVENQHKDGILRKSTAPYRNYPLQQAAQDIMQKLMEELDYIGVMTIEFFVCDDKLIMNEIAPRVHNSGHWTIEGAATSQFEQHLRAITGMPLGPTEVKGTVIMHNCIGEMPDKEAIASKAFYHDYGKQPRPGRKLGHITEVS
jgi:5-(carboxyamino)imidazole ribonucleotide synthase